MAHYDFTQFTKTVQDTEEWLSREYSLLRTGRAMPAVLDAISVESYGTLMKIRELATVNIEDPRTIRIVPWDTTQSKAIEKALQTSDIGISVSADDKGLRVHFPELSTERRMGLVKLAKEKLEDARVAVRTEREKVKEDIIAREKEGKIAEDDKFRFLDELQKKVEEVNERLESLYEKKEKEIQE